MAIRVTATIEGNPRAIFDTVPKARMARAVTQAVTAATRGLQLELREHVTAAYPAFQRYANAVRSTVYPAGRDSLSAAGLIYPRGEQARRVFSAHTEGATIFPGKARALAIPLHNFRTKKGKRTPREFGQTLTFIPFKRSANLIGVLATKAARSARNGALTAAARKQRGTVGRRGLAQALGERWVPQFLLVRRAKLPAAFSPRPILEKWGRQMPDLVAWALRNTP
jgi:hypothetical protein